MKGTLKYLFHFLLFFGQFEATGQNEFKKWYFGNGTGLDFTTSPPSTIAVSSMSTQEGCASVADAGGNLLFYTNGVTIWDRTHNVMANGNGLLGHSSTSQSSLILPLPGSNSIYYVFTNVGFNIPNVSNVNYSIVNMNLSAGNGSVVTKNVVLSADQNTEVLAATKHCNGVDWWIVSHIRNSNAYSSFLLTTNGISSGFTISPSGPTLLSGFSQLKISPNGRRIALNFNGTVYYGNFDNSNGQVSGISTIQSSNAGYGCEFSSNGSKLYTTASNGIYQFDLCQNSPTAIASSSLLLYSQNAAFGSMQLAPDGKIYITYNTTTINCHVIYNPNSLGTACNFATASHTFLPKSIAAGLPNIPSCLFYQKPAQSPYFCNVSSAHGCYGAFFNATLFGSSCTAVTNTISQLVWDFDDPLSGANNISYLLSPTHNFSGNGSYNVKLILHYACGISSDTISQTIVINDNCLSYNSTSISCAGLGSASITAATGTGPFTYTWLPGNQFGAVVNGLTPGGHTVVVNDVGTNYTYSVPITLHTASSLSGTISLLSSPSCFGANNGSGTISGVLGGTGSQNYLWTNGIQTSTVQSPINLSAGIWTVVVTDAITACQITSIIALSQPPAITVNVAASAQTLCAGETATLVANSTGGTPSYNYTWNNATSSPSAIVSEVQAGTVIYTVVSNDINNCSGSATIVVNYIANPSLNVSNASVCPFSVGTLTVSGASSYTWTSASNTTGIVGNIFTDAPGSNTQYTVIGIAFGCTASATASISMLPIPNAIFQTNAPVCDGGNLHLSASGGNSYMWKGPQGFNSSVSNNTINPISLSQAGVYTLDLTSANGCTNTSTVNITVNANPIIGAYGSTLCTSQSLSLISNANVPCNYFWTGPLAYTSNLQNPTLLPPLSISRSGTYVVKATSVAGCTNVANAIVNIISPPSLSVALSSSSLCSQAFNGSPNTITFSPLGANTYTLYTPNLVGSSIPTGPATSLTALPPYSYSTIVGTATLEGSNGICTSLSTFSFTVIPNPTVSITSSTPVICAGHQYTYTSFGASSYTWSATTPNFTTYSNGGIAVSNPNTNAVFSVYGSSLGCNSALKTTSITVYPIPTITLSSQSASICIYNETILKATGTGTTYQWLPATGLNSYSLTSVRANPLKSQTYTVITSANNCTNSASVMLTVLQLPTASITAEKNRVCLYDEIVLKGWGGISFDWNGGPGEYYQGKEVKIKTKYKQKTALFTLTVTDINGCKNNTVTSIEVLGLPDGNLTNYKEKGCAPLCNNFVFNGANDGINSSWTINSFSIKNNKFSYCFQTPGSYKIKGKLDDPATTCSNSVEYHVLVHPKPIADFTYSPLKPTENVDEVVFTNTSSGEQLDQFQWFFTDNKGYNTKQTNTRYLYVQPGDYKVAMVVSNQWQCADTVLKIVSVAPDFAMYVPNAFSPNGDQRNDVFLPVTRSAIFFDLKIYNRWGQEIFHSTDPQQGWDGTFNAEACKQDVYNWTIELSTLSGEKKVQRGVVSLLR